MPQNFLTCDREQAFLMPPSLRDWLPEEHLAWFILAAVEEMDLAAFYAAYRLDGHGRAAHDPAMMVALLLYAYAKGQRSSRAIERACEEDVAYRVIAANQVPDHCTIARFRQQHEDALAGLFGDVLALCAQAGLAGVGVIAVDGTKVHANASHHANRDYEQIARAILEQAAVPSGVAMSSHRSYRHIRAGAGGCATPSAGSTSSAPKSRSRSRARARGGSSKPSAGSRRNTTSSAARTPPTKPTGGGDEGWPALWTPSDALSAARDPGRKGKHHRPRLAQCPRRRAATCRATTPRRSPTSARS